MSNVINVKFKKLTPTAKIFAYQTEGAACADIFADAEVTIYQGETKVIPTNIALEIPEGYEVQIRARSGLSLKQGLVITNGVGTIDADYRGGVGIILTNISKNVIYIRKGDRVGQATIKEVLTMSFEEVEELTNTKRGDGGFGSTGVTESVKEIKTPKTELSKSK